MNKTYVKPTTLSDILVSDALKCYGVVDNKSEDLAVGSPLVLINDVWEKATTTNITNASKCGILCEYATSKATYTIMLIGAVKFVKVDETIKKEFFKSNLIYQ